MKRTLACAALLLMAFTALAHAGNGFFYHAGQQSAGRGSVYYSHTGDGRERADE